MATYYVYSGAAGANNGSSWTDAYTAFGSAVTAATASGDIIKVHKTHTETLVATTNYTFANHVNVLCVDKDASDALAEMDMTAGYITIGAYNLALNGAYSVYLYGLAIKSTSSGTFSLSNSDGSHFEIENCKLWQSSTGTGDIVIGSSSAYNSYARLVGCTIRLGSSSKNFMTRCRVDMVGGGFEFPGTIPTTLLSFYSFGGQVRMEGVDLSALSTTIVPASSYQPSTVTLVSCKLHASVTIMATQSPANRSSAEVFMFNCHSGDTHYAFGHYDALGSTIIETGIYANDGASPDGGTTRTSWKIVTTSAATYYTPYRSPWFDKYHSATSAITPYFEILRDGSSTAYNDDEVWGEFSVQATSGSVLPVLKNDRMTPLGTPAAQTTSSKAASDWTGENATAWFGKIAAPSATTPAEVGYLRARCVVGKASTTVYLDPTIRT